jgi:hypothetical protein
MKVICVTTEHDAKISTWPFTATGRSRLMLTIGKWYRVVDEGEDYYTIIWKDGYKANLSKQYFKTLQQIRRDKLDQLKISTK